MENLTKKLEIYLGSNRVYTKEMFKIIGSIYRGVTNKRFTLADGISALNKLGGAN